MDGYNIEQCTTDNKRTGGVMALIRKGVQYTLSFVECVQNECEDVRFVEFFNNFLDRVSTFNGINLILGDFNFDILKHLFYGEK